MRISDITQKKDNNSQQVTEGYSNYKGLLQMALEKWDKAVEKNWPTGRFSLKVEEAGLDYKIKVEYGLYEVSRARTWIDKAIVTVNTEEHDIDEARAVFAHEMTHINQKFNNFLRWSNKQFDHLEGLARDQSHTEQPAEHEAVLVELGMLLAKDQPAIALKRIKDRVHYLKMFTFKQIVSKWYSMGVTKEQMQKFFTPLRESITNNINAILADMKKRGRKYLIGYGIQFFVFEVQLGKSLNIDFSKELEYVRQQIAAVQDLTTREQERLDKMLPALKIL